MRWPDHDQTGYARHDRKADRGHRRVHQIEFLEIPMPMIDALLPEFEHEMANTRRVLERVPDDRLSWRPHPKSWTMGALATHLATLPSWTVETINRTELDVAPAGQPPQSPVEATSREELLKRFDEHLAAPRAALK